jgi:hypothetical protein
MFNTRYHQHLQHIHKQNLKSSILDDKRTGRYDNVEPIHTRQTLSDKINHMLEHKPSTNNQSIQVVTYKLKGSGNRSSQVAYKRQSTVIGGGNVDYK